jgi:translation initiation factor IF-1
MPRRRVSPAALVFALLVLATVAAFGWAQRQKRDPLVLDRAKFVAVPIGNPDAPRVDAFTPNGDCRFDRIRIRFRMTQSDDATVQVIRPGGRVVITLAREELLKRYRFFTFYWDGRQRGGGIARPGRYKLRVKLLNEDRVLVTPGVIRLHRAPPGMKSACVEGSGP